MMMVRKYILMENKSKKEWEAKVEQKNVQKYEGEKH